MIVPSGDVTIWLEVLQSQRGPSQLSWAQHTRTIFPAWSGLGDHSIGDL